MSVDNVTPGMDIASPTNGLSAGVNSNLSLSISPSANLHSSSAGKDGSRWPRGYSATSAAKQLKPFATEDIKILLLENVNKTGRDTLAAQGYQVDFLKTSLPEDELIQRIRCSTSCCRASNGNGMTNSNSDVHVIGIRSKTQLTSRILREAKNLIVIGCFCIGTNQVDTQYAAKNGIAVFNSPFSNSRSVAELVIAEVIALARQLGDRSNELHKGTWNKVSNGCWEIRGKTLGTYHR